MAKQKLNKTQLAVPYSSTIHGTTQDVNLTPGSTQYVGFKITTNTYSISVPRDGIIKNLFVYTSSAPGVGKDYACTIMKNNVAQALTCIISGSGTNFASDTSHSFTIAAGDRISLRTVITAAATAMPLDWSIEFQAT